MITNLYAIEKWMMERTAEVERTALKTWQWNSKNKKRSFSEWVGQLNIFKEKAPAKPVTACCVCC